MEVFSIKVDKQLKDKMKRFSHVNWSDIIRQTLAAKVQEEESKVRTVDSKSLLEACTITDSIRKSSKKWHSTEEIRRWRQTRQ